MTHSSYLTQALYLGVSLLEQHNLACLAFAFGTVDPVYIWHSVMCTRTRPQVAGPALTGTKVEHGLGDSQCQSACCFWSCACWCPPQLYRGVCSSALGWHSGAAHLTDLVGRDPATSSGVCCPVHIQVSGSKVTLHTQTGSSGPHVIQAQAAILSLQLIARYPPVPCQSV